MDLAPFGLRFRPFVAGPDPTGYYPIPEHEEALAQLVMALREDEPFVSLTGDPGLGKTMLAHLVVQQLEDPTVAFVSNPHGERVADLLQAILYDLGLPYIGRPEQEMRLAIADFAMNNHRDGRRTIILIDEAHLLSRTLLEEVRLLGNLETPRGRAVQVMLIGQPSLLANVDQLLSLAQRLITRAQIHPFGLRESADYIAYQVSRAGGKTGRVFSDEALEVLARGSRGIPRLLNQAAYNALLLAQKAEMSEVDVEAAIEALHGIPTAGPTEPDEDAPPQLFPEQLPPDGYLNTDNEDRPDESTWKPAAFGTPQRFVFTPIPTH